MKPAYDMFNDRNFYDYPMEKNAKYVKQHIAFSVMTDMNNFLVCLGTDFKNIGEKLVQEGLTKR